MTTNSEEEQKNGSVRSLLITLFFPVDLDDDLSLSPKRGSLESCASSQLAIFFCPADSYVSVSGASHCVSTYAVSVGPEHLWTDFDAFESSMTELREFGSH